MSNPNLEPIFNRWLLRLALVADGRSQRLSGDKTGGGGKPGSVILSGESDVDPGPWRERWEAAHWPEQQLLVVRDLRNEVNRLKYARRLNIERGTVEWKLRIGRDERPLAKVMEDYDVSRASVFRYRRLARSPEASP